MLHSRVKSADARADPRHRGCGPERDRAYRWSAHPWRARAIRLLVYATSDRPVARRRASRDLAHRRLQPGRSGSSSLWWLGVSLLATVVVSLVYAVVPATATAGSTSRALPRVPGSGSVAVPGRAAHGNGRVARRAPASHARDPRKRPRPRKPPRSSSASWRRSACTTASREDTPSAYARTATCSVVSSAFARDELDRLNWAALLHDVGSSRSAARS